MNYRYILAAALCGLFAAAGCGFATVDNPDNPTDPSTTTTGIALTVELSGEADVTGMRFIGQTCEGQPVFSQDLDLLDFGFPAGIPAFNDAPLINGEQHAFADFFTVVSAGCYNVEIQPLTENQQPSQACSSALGEDIIVEDGETTEILLVSQCKTQQGGAIDVVAGINVTPTISMVEFQPSKFVQCGEEATICATASDGDADEIAFQWQQADGSELDNGFDISSHTTDGNTATECINLTPESAGTIHVQISAHDDDNGDNNGTDNNGTDNNGTDNNGTDNNGTDNNGTDNNGTDGDDNNDSGDDNGDELDDLSATLTVPVHVYCPEGGGPDNNGTDNNGTDNNGTDNNGTDNNGTDNNGDNNGTDNNGTDNNGDNNGTDNNDV